MVAMKIKKKRNNTFFIKKGNNYVQQRIKAAHTKEKITTLLYAK